MPSSSPVAERMGEAAQVKAVALQKMLAAMYFHRRAFGQRRANGVGAPVGFVPRGAAGERHALGLVPQSRGCPACA